MASKAEKEAKKAARQTPFSVDKMADGKVGVYRPQSHGSIYIVVGTWTGALLYLNGWRQGEIDGKSTARSAIRQALDAYPF